MTLKDLYDKTWDYFKQHADQRIQLMNYFIVLEVFIFTALYTIVTTTNIKTTSIKLICIIIGLSSLFFSFVFYNLDKRTKAMIKNSENIIKNIEGIVKKDLLGTYEEDIVNGLLIFTYEETETMKQRNTSFLPLSYSRCFSLLQFFFAGLGILSTIFISVY